MTSLWYFDNPLKNVFETSTILINARAMELFLWYILFEVFLEIN